ncbi:MAG: aldo/keto reductase [Synechococcales cyanobacterium C42_A2020_086]|nr:aldo/keto reductase [Synechococcales cyanobacterium C42_A2020_086]
MQYRRFGQTNLWLSVFSLGTMRYLASEENAIQTVQQAIELGINHIETARGYGNSEVYLRRALTELALPREHLYLTSKISPTADVDGMARAIDESLTRLGVDYLDCLAIHGLNTEEHLTELAAGGLRAAQQAVAEGKVRHLGFSSHGSLALIHRAINTGWFEFVNLHYYYFNQRNAAAVALAHARDMGVFIISPADKGGMLHTPPPLLEDLCRPFSPLQITYRFLLSDRRVTTLSVGAAHPRELDALLPLTDRTDPLQPEEQAILEQLQLHQQRVLGSDQCSQCYQCLPCPEAIHIPEVLRLRNLAVAYDMTAFGQYRYRMFENAGHWFPGTKASRCTDCGDCLPRCPEQLDIPRLLRDTHDRLNGEPRRRLWG